MNFALATILVLASQPFNIKGYVLLQVRKGENQSNVDALIHKVIPDKVEEIENARKNYKRYEIRDRNILDKVNGLESFVLAINTGASQNKIGSSRSDVVKKVQNLIMDLLKEDRVSTYFRTKSNEYNIKPEIVHFKSGKPSLMLEINFDSIMRSLKDTLSSKTVRQYTDKFAQKAAVVYRTFQDELKLTE